MKLFCYGKNELFETSETGTESSEQYLDVRFVFYYGNLILSGIFVCLWHKFIFN